MLPNYIRLLGAALLVDALLIVITIPITKFLMLFLIPNNAYINSGIIWTYGMVIFSGLLLLTLIVLWVFQQWYAHLFTFWQLIIAMMIVMAGILWWNRGK